MKLMPLWRLRESSGNAVTCPVTVKRLDQTMYPKEIGHRTRTAWPVVIYAA